LNNQVVLNIPSERESRWFSHGSVIAVGIGLVALAMYLWQLTVPEYLQPYDSGVYLAATIHFVSGMMPYRTFTFVQPPGICLLLAPIGIYSRIFGSHDGFIVARVFSATTTALNTTLLALLVRRRGRTAMLVAGAGLALIPVASFVSSGIELDPYCICFALLGSLFLLSRLEKRGRLTNWELLIGGALFGAAALMKLWAVFPFIAIVISLIPQCRSRVLHLFAAAGGVFAVASLPFFIAAPQNFLSQVFVEQLNRKTIPSDTASIGERLIYMSGLKFTSIAPTGREVAVAFVVFGCLIVAAFWRRLGNEAVDAFLLLAAVISVAGLLVAPESYNYYGYFTAPFLLGVLGLCVGRLGAPAKIFFGRISMSQPVKRFVRWSGAVCAAALLGSLVLYVTTFYTNYAWGAGFWAPRANVITALIPRGSCVLYDQEAYGIFANRAMSSQHECPIVVDSGGVWMAWGYGAIPPAPAFAAQWKSYFEVAQYAVLSSPRAQWVPWDASLTAWFNKHYRLISDREDIYIYKRVVTT
jgi:hypothetical protein